jgi:hypothetical protein
MGGSRAIGLQRSSSSTHVCRLTGTSSKPCSALLEPDPNSKIHRTSKPGDPAPLSFQLFDWEKVRLVLDSPLEGTGFEPMVPWPAAVLILLDRAVVRLGKRVAAWLQIPPGREARDRPDEFSSRRRRSSGEPRRVRYKRAPGFRSRGHPCSRFGIARSPRDCVKV